MVELLSLGLEFFDGLGVLGQDFCVYFELVAEIRVVLCWLVRFECLSGRKSEWVSILRCNEVVLDSLNGRLI